MFVSSIVPCAGVTLGVLVGHNRTKSVVDRSRGDVLGGDQRNVLTLALNLSLLWGVLGCTLDTNWGLGTNHELVNLRIRLLKRLLEHLFRNDASQLVCQWTKGTEFEQTNILVGLWECVSHNCG